MDNRLRVVEVNRDDEWQRVRFMDLKIGDRFRLFESEGGEPVLRDNGEAEWVAQGDAYVENDAGTIEVDMPA